jgi:hypothetical protein
MASIFLSLFIAPARAFKLLIAIDRGLSGYVLEFDKNNMLLLYGSSILLRFRGQVIIIGMMKV